LVVRSFVSPITIHDGVVITIQRVRQHPWAQDRYAAARARGHSHRRALRTLGRALCRILWRCWQTHTPYDPERHTGLQRYVTVR
jgi:hypothetical protein